jgi:hypothetical protein
MKRIALNIVLIEAPEKSPYDSMQGPECDVPPHAIPGRENKISMVNGDHDLSWTKVELTQQQHNPNKIKKTNGQFIRQTT